MKQKKDLKYVRKTVWKGVVLSFLFVLTLCEVPSWAGGAAVYSYSGSSGSSSGGSSGGTGSSSGSGSCVVGTDHWGEPIYGCCPGSCCCPSNPHLRGDAAGGASMFGRGGNPSLINDQINLVNGNLVLIESDLTIRSLGRGIIVQRTKANIGIGQPGPFGLGWSSNLFSIRLEVTGSGDVRITGGQGGQRIYFRNPLGGFRASDNSRLILTKNSDGTYDEITPAGGINHFSREGVLEYSQDKNGNRTTYGYTDSKLTTVTDATGRSITITYSGDLITKIVDPLGRENRYEYSGNLLTNHTDPAGYSTSYEYDASYRLTKVTTVVGGTVDYAYDDKGRLISRRNSAGNYKYINYVDTGTTQVTDERGKIWTHRYNSYGMHTAVITPLGREVQMIYGANKRPARLVNPMGDSIAYDYNDTGLLIGSRSVLGDSITREYDNRNRLVRATDQMGHSTTYEYDTYSRLTRKVDPLNNVTTYTYYSNHLRESTTDANNHSRWYEYDQRGNVTRTTNQEGNSREYTYDIIGKVTSSTDEANNTVSYQYDQLGRLKKIIHPDATTIEFTYNGAYLTKRQDQNGQITQFIRDQLGRLTQVIDPIGNSIHYAYDEGGNITAVTDAAGRVTHYFYNEDNQLIRKEYPAVNEGTPIEYYCYDASGHMIAVRTANGDTINYAYDLLGRLTLIDFPSGSDISYDYNRVGKVVKMTDGIGTTEYYYDAMNRLTSISYPDGKALAYEYDGVGNLTAFTDMDDQGMSYSYNDRDRVIGITFAGSLTSSYEYDNVGLNRKLILPNNTYTIYDYDDQRRLIFLGNYRSNGDTISGSYYILDNVGNRKLVSSADGSITEYDYDGKYQLIRETRLDANGDTRYGFEYSYDSAWNRVADTNLVTGIGRNYYYDACNRLVTNSTDTFTYDLNGNMTSMTNDSGTCDYEWFYDNTLTKISDYNGEHRYSYFGNGLRYCRATPTDTIFFVWNPMGINEIAEYSGDGQTTVTNVYSLWTDRPLYFQRDGSYYYFHADGNNSIVNLTDETGAVLNVYSYFGFGETDSSAVTIANEIMYNARRRDRDGQYFYRMRYYNPNSGRFISNDKINGSFYSFAYALNNPITFGDPLGLVPSITGAYTSDCANLISDAIDEVDNRLSSSGSKCDNFLGSTGCDPVGIMLSANFNIKSGEWTNEHGQPIPGRIFESDLSTIELSASACDLDVVLLADVLLHESSHICERSVDSLRDITADYLGNDWEVFPYCAEKFCGFWSDKLDVLNEYDLSIESYDDFDDWCCDNYHPELYE